MFKLFANVSPKILGSFEIAIEKQLFASCVFVVTEGHS